MARLLITGAAGFVGSHLAQRCLERGDDVVGIDAMTPYYDPAVKRENVVAMTAEESWNLVEGDLKDVDLESHLDGVDTVFHLAAQPGVRASWGRTFGDYVDSNVTALQHLLEACRDLPLQRFVFASSSSVYGDAARFPTDESTELRPVSPYGATKVLGEHLCRLYHRSHGVPVVTLRYFTVYGPRQRPDMAFHKLIGAALRDEEITIYGDGEQTRDFTYVDDAVGGTVAAALGGAPGSVYNLGGGAHTSMNEVLEMISTVAEKDLRVRRVEAQAGDARDTAADIGRARAELGYSPSCSLGEGLARQIAWRLGARESIAGSVGTARDR
jgi:UDP-glucose 4-epimerase